MRHLYRIDDGESHWYSATSEAEAVALFRADPLWDDERDDSVTVIQEPDDKPITPSEDGRRMKAETKTAAQWAAEHTEPTVLFSTVFA